MNSTFMAADEVEDQVTAAFYVSKGTDDGGAVYCDGVINVIAEGNSIKEIWHAYKTHPGSVISRSFDGATYFEGMGIWIDNYGDEVG